MTMTAEQRASLNQLFDHMKKRPGMWFSGQVPPIVTWFQGFQMAFKLQHPALDVDAQYAQVILQRGWESGAQAVWRQMEAKGMSPEAINAELLAIYAEVWDRISLTIQPDPVL
jgi:hypothetical protein